MKRNTPLRALSLLLCLALLCPVPMASAAGTGHAAYANTRELAEGFRYTNEIRTNANGSRVESYSLTIEPHSPVRPVVMACDTVYGGLTIDKMVIYAESLGYNVVAAMNADFGYWSTRIPCGVVVEDGIYKSSPEQCNALALTADGAFFSALPEVTLRLTTADGAFVNFTHYNKSREEYGGLYLYSEYFSTVSTRTSTEGWAVRFEIEEGDLALGGELTLTVKELYEGKDARYIGANNLILTASKLADIGYVFDKFAEGDTVRLAITPSDERLTEASWITGCGDILVENGTVYYPAGWDSSISGYHPRSVAGIKPDGTLIFRVVDGRSSASAGATLQQMAEDFLAEGCTEVVNLDGGGSSAFTLRVPGTGAPAVQNVPSDGTLRACPSYLLFVTDGPRDGKAVRLHVKEDGVLLLAGSSLPLTLLATDGGLAPASLPADAAARSAGLGAVENGVYTAGDTAGPDTLWLESERIGATGTGTVQVIAAADSISVTNAATGKAVNAALRMDVGDTLAFAVSATSLRRPVVMDREAVVYTVEGNIGAVDENGVFTASAALGEEGTITVAAAGQESVYTVRVGAYFDDIYSHWARDYIEKLFEENIVKGVTETSFAPDAEMRRADFLLMLYRAATGGEKTPEPVETPPATDLMDPETGLYLTPDPDVASEEDPDGEAGPEAEPGRDPEDESAPEPGVEPTEPLDTGFTDVAPDAYYAAAVAWAAANGIAQGTGDGLFQPLATLTREQAFTFVRRALPVLGITAPEADAAALEDFSDAADVSAWAQEATAVLIRMGLVQGDAGKLTPKASLTRSQMAKILCTALF